jgi:hypothetical protein
MKKGVLSIMCGLLIFCCLNGRAIGFDDEVTHPTITDQAVNNKKYNLDIYLRNYLGLVQGLKTIMPSNSGTDIMMLIKKGSKDEDKEACRRSNHMHDPTKDWYISYMTDEPWGDANTAIGCALLGPYDKKYSNITWAFGQYMKDGPVWDRDGQDMGWDDARRYFSLALKATTNTEREANYAKTFQALGQVLHLLQDMAVPAHTRNGGII